MITLQGWKKCPRCQETLELRLFLGRRETAASSPSRIAGSVNENICMNITSAIGSNTMRAMAETGTAIDSATESAF
jgi:hypothetical protein